MGNLGVSGVFGLASPDNQSLYGVAGTSIYNINPQTGAANLLVNYSGHGLGTAYGETFFTEAQTSVTPEPSSFVLLASGLFMLVPFLMRNRMRHSL